MLINRSSCGGPCPWVTVRPSQDSAPTAPTTLQRLQAQHTRAWAETQVGTGEPPFPSLLAKVRTSTRRCRCCGCKNHWVLGHCAQLVCACHTTSPASNHMHPICHTGSCPLLSQTFEAAWLSTVQQCCQRLGVGTSPCKVGALSLSNAKPQPTPYLMWKFCTLTFR